MKLKNIITINLKKNKTSFLQIKLLNKLCKYLCYVLNNYVEEFKNLIYIKWISILHLII